MSNRNSTQANSFFSTQGYNANTSNFVMVFETRDPTSDDVNYPIQKIWVNTAVGKTFVLIGFDTSLGYVQANWLNITVASNDLSTLTGDDNLPVDPINSNINVVSSTQGAIQFDNGGAGILEATVRTDNKTIYVNSSNELTVNNSGTFWQTITTNQNLQDGYGYIVVSPAGVLNLTLPATSAVGDTVEILLRGGSGFIINQLNNQQIFYLGNTTTLGTAGTIASTLEGDYVKLICVVANTEWSVINVSGSIILT
jgi:hypothetical protein